MQAYRASSSSVCTSLSKSVSMSVIDSYPDADGEWGDCLDKLLGDVVVTTQWLELDRIWKAPGLKGIILN